MSKTHKKMAQAKKQGLRKLIARSEHIRKTIAGLEESLGIARDQLVGRRPAGHEFWYARGRKARWVFQKAYRVPSYTMPARVGVKVGKRQ